MSVHEIISRVIAEIQSAWRFRWYGAVLAWLASIAGIGAVTLLDDVYEAQARVYVDASSVLRPLLNNRIVPQDIGALLAYVRQQLLGREHLEEIIAINGLDSEANTLADHEALLLRLRNEIRIVSRDMTNSVYTITYQDSNPVRAVGVVGTLLNSLVGETLGENQASTETVERFVSERIHEYEMRLQEAEQARADFMKRNAQRLPGSQGGYYQRMQAEQDGLEAAERNLRLAMSRRDELRAQLSSESPIDLESDLPATSVDARIADYKAQLERLLLQYTDQHPDVIAIRETVARLEGQRAAQIAAIGESAGQNFPNLGSNPIYQALRIALNEAEVEIATTQADVADRQRRLAELRLLVDELPQVEAELARLNRDYDVVFEQYQGLVRSRETQGLSEKAFDTDKVDFRIIDPPSARPEPVSPNRVAMLAAVFVLSLGAAVALCWLMAQVRPVFGSTESLRIKCGLPVLGAVSAFGASRHRLRKILGLAGFVGVMSGLVLIFASALIVEVSGPGLRSLAGLA